MVLISLVILICFSAASAQDHVTQQAVSRARLAERSPLSGVYRIDITNSDKLYSVVAGASSKIPFGEQQRFFIDLAVRLTPPDLLAIDQRGTRISLGSSRAPRMTFVADGVARSTRAADGHLVRVRFSVEHPSGNSADSSRLVFTSSGRTEDNFSVTFEAIDDGKRLKVTRRIAAESLDQPLVIQTLYNKISDVARWELYGEAQVASSQPARTPSPHRADASPVNPAGTTVSSAGSTRPATEADPAAEVLRQSLNEWIEATNKRDINKQMSFYVPRLKAYYLTRDTSQSFVREEKSRVFATAKLIEIRAEEPEIIFRDGGRTAIMRYRKTYRIENGRRSRRGQVIQELRWQRTGDDGREWRIFSERDIRVL